jgi:hypothetical protein
VIGVQALSTRTLPRRYDIVLISLIPGRLNVELLRRYMTEVQPRFPGLAGAGMLLLSQLSFPAKLTILSVFVVN